MSRRIGVVVIDRCCVMDGIIIEGKCCRIRPALRLISKRQSADDDVNEKRVNDAIRFCCENWLDCLSKSEK